MTLHQEFPHYDSLISGLKSNDKHFKHLFEKYETLNHKIHGLEATQIYTDDEILKMKSERLHLKDSIVKILQQNDKND